MLLTGNDNYLTNWIEDMYGCNIEFQFLPASITRCSVKAERDGLPAAKTWVILSCGRVLQKNVIANYADAGAILNYGGLFRTAGYES